MKKQIIAALIGTGMTASALAQGTVQFENAAGTGAIRINTPTGAYAAAGSYTVALLWANSASLVPQSSLTQIAIYHPTAAAGDGPGYFYGPVVTTPAGSGPMVFEVQAWTGLFTSYAAAIQGNAPLTGQTAEFLNNTGTVSPPGPVVNLSGTGGGWDGNLILSTGDPEPSTLAIAGLGAGALWYFRRRKAG